jgi:hypothetical protein
VRLESGPYRKPHPFGPILASWACRDFVSFVLLNCWSKRPVKCPTNRAIGSKGVEVLRRWVLPAVSEYPDYRGEEPRTNRRIFLAL